MTDPDDWIGGRQFVLAIVCKRRNQRLRMHEYEVVTWIRAMFLGVDIGIVAVDEDVGTGFSEGDGEEVGGPEDAILSGPRLLRLPIQAMHEDDIYLGIGVSVDSGGFVARDLLVDRALSRQRPCQHGTYTRLVRATDYTISDEVSS